MNRDNLTQLADHLEKVPEEGFDMRDVFFNDTCGTPACIAGYAAYLSGARGWEYSPYVCAAEWLGLGNQQRARLFCPETATANYGAAPDDPRYISKRMAVAVLRHAAKTGRISWTKAREQA